MVPSSSLGKIFELLPFPPIKNEIFFFGESKSLQLFLFFSNFLRSTKLPNVVITFLSTFFVISCFGIIIWSNSFLLK